jgi:lipoprotein NlpI
MMYNNRCSVHNNRRENDLALADCDEAIRLDPKNATAYNNRCWAHNNRDESDLALADCNEAIRLDPKNLGPYANRGNAYLAQGDYDRAMTDFNEASRLDPKNAVVYNGRGNVYFAKADYGRAIADYSAAIGADPKFAVAYFERGLAHLYSGAGAEAVADLIRVHELIPKDPQAVLWLDIANRRNNLPSRLAEAEKQVDMNRWPAPVIRLYLGQLTPAAVLTAADDPDPQTKKVRVCQANFYIAELALQRGDKDDATIRLFRSVVADCPRTGIERFAATAELHAIGANP